ncbi:MAG: tyrosine-type recombinase/integrase [Lachnospiraceae bacterium]|nr:tyrosine-type recombinase/integrase [Lachnospiraceae bacterium]
MANRSYHDQFRIDTDLKLREKCKELPAFCSTFFRGIEATTSARTRMAYAFDLKIFFTYIKNETGLGGNKEITEYHISILDKVTPTIIQDYMDYLKVYNNDQDVECTNSERGLMRKLSSLRSMYKYFYRMEMIKNNPASIIQMPKLHEKEIIRLDKDEVEELLDTVESGKSLTKQQQNFHDKTKVRDLAIVTLLLGTGIRVSECVGLDLNDVDFKNHGIRITRKGGNQVVVYFGDEVEDALFNYLRERSNIIPMAGHEEALFLSMQKRRITVKSVERLVKKYAGLVTQVKKITPHKLRSTYGTQLYKQTGDIYLVADVLGHSDVNTTKKHYAALEDERRRMARNMVSLREETNDDNLEERPADK